MHKFPANHLGRHILAEFLDCDQRRFDEVDYVEYQMKRAALEAGATIVDSCFHHFSPYGVSGVVVISESHLTIHTWPEMGYAAVDVFTCGPEADPALAIEYLKEAFGAQRVITQDLPRGSLADIRASMRPAPAREHTEAQVAIPT